MAQGAGGPWRRQPTTRAHLHEQLEAQAPELWAALNGHHGGGGHVRRRALDGRVDGGALGVAAPAPVLAPEGRAHEQRGGTRARSSVSGGALAPGAARDAWEATARVWVPRRSQELWQRPGAPQQGVDAWREVERLHHARALLGLLLPLLDLLTVRVPPAWQRGATRQYTLRSPLRRHACAGQRAQRGGARAVAPSRAGVRGKGREAGARVWSPRTARHGPAHLRTVSCASSTVVPKSLARPCAVLPYAMEKLRILALRRSDG